MSDTSIDQDTFKESMARFPAGVTVTTTTDPQGAWWGFTANAFSSVSLEPPLALVCLDCSADCHSPFLDASVMAINILRAHQGDVAMRFATKGADKFAGGGFEPGSLGAPILREALVTLECEIDRTVPGGDHTILIGRVRHARHDDGEPMVVYNRRFWKLTEDGTASG